MSIIKMVRRNCLKMFCSSAGLSKATVGLIVFLILITRTTPVVAQHQRLSDNNSIGWLVYTGTLHIKPKVSIHTEYQWRRVNTIKSPQQSLLRGALNYAVRKDMSLHAGYAFAETYPYGDFPGANVFPEHRIYQQVVLKNPIGKAEISHRFTLEQRFLRTITGVADQQNIDWVFLNRMRYRVRAETPIYKKGWTIAFQDELFIGWGKNIGVNIFDQNRLTLSLGYRVNQSIKFEAGYLNQILQQGKRVNDKTVFQYNHGFMIASHLSLNLY